MKENKLSYREQVLVKYPTAVCHDTGGGGYQIIVTVTDGQGKKIKGPISFIEFFPGDAWKSAFEGIQKNWPWFDLPELDDFSGTLDELQTIIHNALEKYGPTARISFSAGQNNISAQVTYPAVKKGK